MTNRLSGQSPFCSWWHPYELLPALGRCFGRRRSHIHEDDLRSFFCSQTLLLWRLLFWLKTDTGGHLWVFVSPYAWDWLWWWGEASCQRGRSVEICISFCLIIKEWASLSKLRAAERQSLGWQWGMMCPTLCIFRPCSVTHQLLWALWAWRNSFWSCVSEVSVFTIVADTSRVKSKPCLVCPLTFSSFLCFKNAGEKTVLGVALWKLRNRERTSGRLAL